MQNLGVSVPSIPFVSVIGCASSGCTGQRLFKFSDLKVPGWVFSWFAVYWFCKFLVCWSLVVHVPVVLVLALTNSSGDIVDLVHMNYSWAM